MASTLESLVGCIRMQHHHDDIMVRSDKAFCLISEARCYLPYITILIESVVAYGIRITANNSVMSITARVHNVVTMPTTFILHRTHSLHLGLLSRPLKRPKRHLVLRQWALIDIRLALMKIKTKK